jgi:hypothetical protein
LSANLITERDRPDKHLQEAPMSSSTHRILSGVVVAAGLFCALAGDAEPVVVKPGTIVLPISGLAITLPADPRADFTWNLSGSFSLAEGGASFDGRDVLDEKLKGKLIAGTWVQVGYFDAGECKATVASTELTNAWTEDRDLFGVRWCLRGGLFDLGQDLGKVPAVAMCAHREGRKDLLLHRFFLDLPSKATREDLLASLPKSRALEPIVRAWQQNQWAEVKPRRRPEVRNRGKVEPTRTVNLTHSALSLALPDDGLIWLARRTREDEGVDWLDLMAPALNEVSLEVVRARSTTCQAVFDSLTTEKRYDAPPMNVPEGWTIGPTLVVNGTLERVICRRFGSDSILVGFFTVPDKGRGAGDFAVLEPLLAAITAAATKH